MSYTRTRKPASDTLHAQMVSWCSKPGGASAGEIAERIGATTQHVHASLVRLGQQGRIIRAAKVSGVAVRWYTEASIGDRRRVLPDGSDDRPQRAQQQAQPKPAAPLPPGVPRPGEWQLRDQFGRVWPPGFVSQIHTPEADLRMRQSIGARDMAQQNRAARRGWGDGTIVMPGTPGWLPPGDMQPAGAGGGR